MDRRRNPALHRLALPLSLAMVGLALQGCSDEQFRELLVTVAFGLVVLVAASICLSLINLTVLGGGIAMLAINLLGTPTHRTRTYGFVFGGLNVATGITGLVGALSAMFVFHTQLAALIAPPPTDATQVQISAAPDLFAGGIVGIVMSLGSLALGVATIAVAARARPVDLVPRGDPSAASAPPT